ncbi:putative mucin/carbohydrate-binding domain-containing protein [Lactococcus garvieae]
MNFKKTIAALTISASVLGAVTPTIVSFAAENNQETTHQQNQTVSIPDANLRKALNKKLNQPENANITAEQLATITELDVGNQNITSIEGLQYCVNLNTLKIGRSMIDILTAPDESNNISDLTPLKNLTHLKILIAGHLPITDFSPLKNVPLVAYLKGHEHDVAHQTYLSSDLSVTLTDKDKTITWKNPFIAPDGTPMIPCSLKGSGATYDKKTNTITWSEDTFKSHSVTSQGSTDKPTYQMSLVLSQQRYCFANVEVDGTAQVSVDIYNDRGAAYNAVTKLFKKTGTGPIYDEFDPYTIADDLTQEKIDEAYTKVEALPDNARISVNANTHVTKKQLEETIHNAQCFFDYSQSTNSLFKDSLPNSNALAEGVTQERITQEKNKDEKLHDGGTKTTLINLVAKAQQIFDATQKQEPVQTIDLFGIGTSAGKDTHFAQLQYDSGEGVATLHEGVNMYGCPIHPYFKKTYASVTAKDKEGNLLFSKDFKGTDYVQTRDEQFTLPEGATLDIYHAEGASRRYTTNDNETLKQQAGTLYHYTVKDGKLSQHNTEVQEFKFLGLCDFNFAKLDVFNGNMMLESRATQFGSHRYFKNRVYASVVVKDNNGKELFEKKYIGDKNALAGLESVELKEGYTVTIHHEEPHRLATNNDANLHKGKNKDFVYKFTNQQLVEQ